MKKIILVVVIILLPLLSAGATGTSIAAGLGADFFNYRSGQTYLSTSLTLLQRIGEDMDFTLGAEFALTTEPRFFVPVSGGLNFYFPFANHADLLLGLGLTPVFMWAKGADSDETIFRFYMGPYIKGGFQLQTHRYMKLFLELQQDLLIGAPDWINTATRLHAGVVFIIP